MDASNLLRQNGAAILQYYHGPDRHRAIQDLVDGLPELHLYELGGDELAMISDNLKKTRDFALENQDRSLLDDKINQVNKHILRTQTKNPLSKEELQELYQNFDFADQQRIAHLKELYGEKTLAELQLLYQKDKQVFESLKKFPDSWDPLQIENIPLRIEFIKFAAAHKADYISEHIQNYRIKDQKTLIMIAKIAATSNGKNTLQFLQNYKIIDRQGLDEIARIIAIRNPVLVLDNLRKFGIVSIKTVCEILKMAAIQDPKQALSILKSLKSENYIENLLIFLMAHAQTRQDLSLLSQYEIPSTIADAVKNVLEKGDFESFHHALKKIFYYHPIPPYFLKLFDQKNLPDSSTQKAQLEWGLFFAFSYQSAMPNHSFIDNHPQLVEELFKCPDPIKRNQLTRFLTDHVIELNRRDKVTKIQNLNDLEEIMTKTLKYGVD